MDYLAKKQYCPHVNFKNDTCAWTPNKVFMRLGSLGTWAWVPRLGKSRQVEASRRLVRALVDGRFARSARRQ